MESSSILLGVFCFIIIDFTTCGAGMLIDDEIQRGRLLGSTEAEPNAFPYTVVCLGQDVCGGALISESYIVTSASCIDGQSMVFAYIGVHDRTKTEPDRERRLIEEDQFIVHEGWDPATFKHNIALLALDEPVAMTQKIQTISLPWKSSVYERQLVDSILIATGWGYAGGLEYEAKLHYMNATISPLVICKHYYSKYITEDHLCIDGSLGQSGCKGDVGDPLVLVPKDLESIEFSSDFALVGIQSFVPKIGCTENWPTVYTKISPYLDWIAEKAGIVVDDTIR